MILLGTMCFKSNNQITKALTITQLTKHHYKQLIPTSEVFHVAIAIILANVVVKLSPVQKSCKLSKNVFVSDCKVTKSSPFHFKSLLNRLYFNYFKERLVYFNGTLVLVYNSGL